MIAIDMTGQTPLDYVEERIERGEGFVWIGHDLVSWSGEIKTAGITEESYRYFGRQIKGAQYGDG